MKIKSQLRQNAELKLFLSEIRSAKLTLLLDESYPAEVRRMIALANSWRRASSFESIGAEDQAADWFLKVAEQGVWQALDKYCQLK